MFLHLRRSIQANVFTIGEGGLFRLGGQEGNLPEYSEPYHAVPSGPEA